MTMVSPASIASSRSKNLRAASVAVTIRMTIMMSDNQIRSPVEPGWTRTHPSLKVTIKVTIKVFRGSAEPRLRAVRQ